MKLEHVYRASLLVSALFYVMYWFANYAYYMLDSEIQILLSNGGFAAWYELPDWWYWSFFVAVVLGYIGMFLFRKHFLWLFLVTTVLGLLLSPAMGMSVITGIEVFLIDTSTLLQGFALALALYTPLRDRFY